MRKVPQEIATRTRPMGSADLRPVDVDSSLLYDAPRGNSPGSTQHEISPDAPEHARSVNQVRDDPAKIGGDAKEECLCALAHVRRKPAQFCHWTVKSSGLIIGSWRSLLSAT